MILQTAWPRAATRALLGVSVTTCAHTGAGGSPPSAMALLVLLVLTTVLSRVVQGAGGELARTTGVLFGAQVLAHVWLSISMPMPMRHSGAAMGMVPAPGGHTHAEPLRRLGNAAGPQIIDGVAAAIRCLLEQPAMLVAHVLAGLLIGLWLTSGERAADRAVSWSRNLWRPIPQLLVLLPAGRELRTRPIAAPAPARTLILLLAREITHRGPPRPLPSVL